MQSHLLSAIVLPAALRSQWELLMMKELCSDEGSLLIRKHFDFCHMQLDVFSIRVSLISFFMFGDAGPRRGLGDGMGLSA